MRSIGRLADVVGSRRTDPDAPQTERERITALEKRVATLELLLNDVMHQLDHPQRDSNENVCIHTTTGNQPQTQATVETQVEATAKTQAEATQKHKQSWDDPERLTEISALADRILAETSLASLTKAETVSRFGVDSKLAGQTLAWLVMKGKMSMLSPEPTQDDPDPKKIFRLK